MINQIKLQKKKVQEVCFTNIKCITFCLLPENIVYSMLKSDKTDKSSIAMRSMLEISSCKREGSIVNKISKVPVINSWLSGPKFLFKDEVEVVLFDVENSLKKL